MGKSFGFATDLAGTVNEAKRDIELYKFTKDLFARNKSSEQINNSFPNIVLDIPKGLDRYIPVQSSPEITKAGVTPNTQVQTPTSPGTTDTQLAHELIQAVANPQSGVESVKLPSGLEVSGITPDKLQGLEVSGGPRVPANNAPPVGKQTVTNPVATTQQPSSNFLNDGRLGYVLGRAAQAVTATAPNSFQYQLGGLGAELGQSQAYSQYLEDLQTGKTPGGYANILSPQQKAVAEERVIAERKLALDETNAGVQRDLIKAQTAGTLTAEEKKNLEAQRNQTSKEIAKERNLTAKEINDARLVVQMKLGEDKNNWMAMGRERNYAFNWKTGKIIKVAPTEGGTGPGASPIGNLNSAMYNQFQEAAVAEFLPQVYKKHKAFFEEKGWTNLVELKNALTNSKTGQVDWSALMPDLTPEERAKFGDRLAEYTVAQLQGIPYTVKFADIMNKKAQEQKLTKPDNVAQEDWDAASPEQRKQLVDYLQSQGTK